MAIESQGVYVHWNDALIAEVVSVSQAGTGQVIDVTHLTSDAAEKLMGLIDEGQASFEVNYVKDDAAQKALIADRKSRTLRACKIYLTNQGGQILTFDAYCVGCAMNVAVNQAVKGTLTLEVTGEVNYSPLLEVQTAYNEGTGNLILDLSGDTFAAALACENVDNWTWGYGGSGLVRNTVVRTLATRVTINYTTGAGNTGSWTMTVQAKAAALAGAFPSGILSVPITIT